jgi:hypothetical protein
MRNPINFLPTLFFLLLLPPAAQAVTGGATHFSITAPATATAGTAFSFTVTALDASNAVATGFTDLIHFTSSDGQATLPADTFLTNGVGTFSATLKTAGNQTITATDTVTSSTTGTSNNIAVSAASATHFTVSAPGTTMAGTAFSFTVTALDQFNNTVTNYTGTVHFTGSDGAATLPADTSLTNGVGTFSATLRTTGNQTITGTDTLTSSITGTSITINVTAAGGAHFAISAPASATAGTAFNLTITAQDPFNNTVTGYTGTVHFTSSDGQATLPADTTLTNGVGTFSATLKTAGSQTITGKDTLNASITGTSNTIAVSAASATHYTVSAPASATAGTAFNLTVTALDQFNNTATTYSGTVHFTSSDGGATLPANSTLTNGTGTFAVTLRAAGNQTLTATDTVTSSITGTSNTSAVSAASATHFTVSTPSTATAGTAFNFTVTAQDQFNNTATTYSGTVHFTSSDGQATLPADTSLTNGVGTFSATLKTAGSQTITGTDSLNSSIRGTSNTIAVSAASATRYTVSAPASATAGAAFNLTVTALDQFNNTATTYSGTVHFTSSDGSATLPGNSTLTNGTGTFSVTLRTASGQTITGTDTVTSSVTGTSSTITVSLGSTTIHLLGPGACPAGSNWSNPACWDLNRAPTTGDTIVIDNGAQAVTLNDLGPGIQFASLTINSASSAVTVTGNVIGMQSGATITDSFNNNGTDTLPSIALNGPVTFSVTPASQTLRISGAIAGAFGLTKTGGGTLLLAGTNTYSGSTTVSGGTLNVTGSLANSAVTVGSGGTLTGTGTIQSLAAQSGGTVSGNLAVTGSATFAAGSIFAAVLSSNTSFSKLTVNGITDLTAGPTLTVALAPGFTPTTGTAFTIVPGAVTGAFTGLSNGATFSAGGVTFRVNYASVTLTVSPAPSIPALSWWGLVLLAILLASLATLVLTGWPKQDTIH